jgi:hypothetical protein
MRGAAVLLACMALAGCGGVKTGEVRQKEERARAAQVAKLSGWNRAFQPDVAIGAANQFGFRATPFAPAQGGFASIGGPVTIANSYARKPNAIAFEARGAKADRVDSIRFRLAITDAQGTPDALKRTADLVRDYLFQSKIDAKPIHDAIAKGTAGKGQLAGVDYAIEKAADRLTVTFHRTGASAPANS